MLISKAAVNAVRGVQQAREHARERALQIELVYGYMFELRMNAKDGELPSSSDDRALSNHHRLLRLFEFFSSSFRLGKSAANQRHLNMICIQSNRQQQLRMPPLLQSDQRLTSNGMAGLAYKVAHTSYHNGKSVDCQCPSTTTRIHKDSRSSPDYFGRGRILSHMRSNQAASTV